MKRQLGFTVACGAICLSIGLSSSPAQPQDARLAAVLDDLIGQIKALTAATERNSRRTIYAGFHYECGLQHSQNNCVTNFQKWAQMECTNADFRTGRPGRMTFVPGNNHSPGSVIMSEIICLE